MGRCQASSYNCLGHSKLKQFRVRFTRTRPSAITRPMKRGLSSTGKSRLDNNPKRDDIQICRITCSAEQVSERQFLRLGVFATLRYIWGALNAKTQRRRDAMRTGRKQARLLKVMRTDCRTISLQRRAGFRASHFWARRPAPAELR
jgi:hypothetical protein